MSEGPLLKLDYLRIGQRVLTAVRELRGDTKIDSDGKWDRPKIRAIKQRLIELREVEELRQQQRDGR